LLADIAFDAVVSTFQSLPRPRRNDPDSVAQAVRGAVRSAIAEHWGKKPMCTVHVLPV
jgi:ribonuclease J